MDTPSLKSLLKFYRQWISEQFGVLTRQGGSVSGGVARALGLSVLAGAALAQGAPAWPEVLAKYPPTGQMVDVGGYKLHLYCQGSGSPGSPTVVLEAGSGASGLYWSLVQPEVAKTARVCVYDRAGYGWSEASPKPRTYGVMAEELHTLLKNASIAGPYLLVGHSLGGIIVRHFAYQYPQEVAGLVLVDSATEGQMERFPAALKKLQSPDDLLKLLQGFEAAITSGEAAKNPDAFLPLEPRLPRQTAETFRALMLSHPKQVRAVRAELEAIADEKPRPLPSLGNLKLVVLSHGYTDPAGQPGVPPEVIREYEGVWAQLQAELAALSSNSKRVVAEKSGHNIQLERPDLVVQAIREVLGQ